MNSHRFFALLFLSLVQFVCLLSMQIYVAQARMTQAQPAQKTTGIAAVTLDSLYAHRARLQTDTARIRAVVEFIQQYGKADTKLSARMADTIERMACLYPAKGGTNLLQAYCWQARAVVLGWQTQRDSSILLYQKALQVYHILATDSTIAEARYALALAYYNAGRSDSALVQYDHAIVTMKKFGWKSRLARVYNDRGVLFTSRGEYEKGLESLFAGLKLREEYVRETGKRQIDVAGSFKNIGVQYWYLQQFDMAIDYTMRALNIVEELNVITELSPMYINLGLYYSDKREYDKSLGYYFKALALQEQLKNDYAIAAAYNNIALVYRNKKDYATSLDYAQRSLAIFKKNDNRTRIPNTTLVVAEMHTKLGKYAEAETGFREGLRLARANKMRIEQKEGYEEFAELWRLQGKYDSAYHYHTLFAQLADTLRTETSSKKIAEMQARYDNETKQRAIDMLELQRLRQAIELTHANTQVDLEHAEAERQHEAAETAEKQKELKEMELGVQRLAAENRAQEAETLQRTKQLQTAELARQSAELSRQAALRNAGIAIAGLLALLLVIVFIGQRRQKRNNQELIRQRNLLETQAVEIQLANTEMQERNLALGTANEKLKELGGFKEAMMGMIVHDLKNPLNAVIGLSDTSDMRTSQGLPLAAARRINQAGQQMLTLVMNILDVQKFENAALHLVVKDCQAYTLMEEAVHSTMTLLQEKSLQYALQADGSVFMRVDRDAILRVLVNMLTNAIKFTPPQGSIILRAGIDVNNPAFVCISVSDTGVGIPAHKLDDVFEKFTQVEAKNSGMTHSTGLGLTFCKIAVETHGGAIWIESELGKGTTFFFTLPRAVMAPGTMSGTVSAPALAPAITGTPYIPEQTIEEHSLPVMMQTIVALSLNEQEKETLRAVIPAFHATDVYEVSVVSALLASIIATEDSMLARWKDQMQSAMYQCDEEQFAQLLKYGES
jgi:signal transduction histidine kinase/tetratricopeptide (TPR) repeat protein